MAAISRQNPVGAEVQPGGGAHFRVWAPLRRSVDVLLEPDGAAHPLGAERDGYFSGLVLAAGAGTRYRYRLDGAGAFPDPASRYQPDGPHGPSQVIDPSAFRWTDAGWRGVEPTGQVLYELHLGTFTPEGTWRAAAALLAGLAELGVTVVEVMPVADFPGRFGWGYDGVDLYAPSRLYGTPDDVRAFVDGAHQVGLGVILDVVYNHLGPDGNYLTQFSDRFLSREHATDWGEPIDFGRPAVREFYVANAAYWIREYHLDGLRLDATQNIYDRAEGGGHILAEVARAARRAAGGRRILLVAENEPQDVRLVEPPERGGFGLDALWNDDFHHSTAVAATGRREAYYSDHRGAPQELISAARWGFLFQGQRYGWQRQPRGTPALHLPPAAFVHFLQNHDQVANSARGERLHQLTTPGRWRALTALLLLGPPTPLLFQGQEFAASAPFLYFADHGPELARAVHDGRLGFLAQFPSLRGARIADPAAEETFARCKLDPRERTGHREALALHRDLLRLRREDPVFRAQRGDWLHGAVLAEEAFLLRFLAASDDRLLWVNLGRDLHLAPAPEPLLAPPAGRRWRLLWSSEDPRYGGGGTPPLETDEGWRIPGHAAVVLVPEEEEDGD